MAMIVFSCFFSINIDYFPVEHGLFPCHLCGTRVVQPHLDWKRKMVRSHMTGSLPSIQHNYGKSHENPMKIPWIYRYFMIFSLISTGSHGFSQGPNDGTWGTWGLERHQSNHQASCPVTVQSWPSVRKSLIGCWAVQLGFSWISLGCKMYPLVI